MAQEEQQHKLGGGPEYLSHMTRQLETEARDLQSKLGGPDSAVLTAVVPGGTGLKSNERIKFLESENATLQKKLEDCEEALNIANQETDKANKVALEAKSRVKDLEDQVQAAGAKAADLELQLKNAEEQLAAVEDQIRVYQGKLNEVQQTNAQIEEDLKTTRSTVHDKELKVRAFSTEIADKDAKLHDREAVRQAKQAKLGDLSGEAEHYKTRAIPAEQKASEVEGYAFEESKLTKLQEEKDKEIQRIEPCAHLVRPRSHKPIPSQDAKLVRVGVQLLVRLTILVDLGSGGPGRVIATTVVVAASGVRGHCGFHVLILRTTSWWVD